MSSENSRTAKPVPGQWSFRVTGRSAAPPETVFAVLADGAGWSQWAGPLVTVSRWERQGSPEPEGIGAVRHLGTKHMYGVEEIVAYEPPVHHAYSITGFAPTTYYRGDVYLRSDGAGTHIDWDIAFEPARRLAGPVLKQLFRLNVGSFARRLAAHAEQVDQTR